MKTRKHSFRTYLLGILMIVGLTSCTQKETTVTIFHGGTILTVDSDFSEVEAIAIEGDKIVATGDLSNLQKEFGKQASLIDLEGKTMLPGFIDPHAHVVAGASVDYLMEYVGMSRFKTSDEVLKHLKEMADNAEPGKWIAARNWDPAVQDGPEELTIKDLDAVSVEHPVFILNASGHLAYANSKAFEVAGITNKVTNPDGAEFVRDANGDLTGVMKNMASFIQVWMAMPEAQTVDPVEAILALTGDWNSKGITTTTELALGVASNSTADWDVLKAVGANPELTTRIRAYPSYLLNDEWTEVDIQPNDGNDLVRLVGFKLVADGSNQGYTGLQREPYCCGMHQGTYGKEYTSVEALTRFARQRAAQGWQLAVHGNGDAAIDNILTMVENLIEDGIDIEPLRIRIEHASIIHDEQFEKMKNYGISASFLIGHVHYWGVWLRDMVFGEEKVQLLDRAHSAECRNISYTLHSDFMVTNPDPLEMIQIAVNRNTFKEPNYKISPEESVSVESAIRALTSEAAWQCMSEHEIGSIEVGKYADLVILENDPRKVDSYKISEIEVVETWMNGKMVFQNN
ncbi:amidohydrolase [Carboxylicivirga sediminis]|uniref:Amidohydrolase n=1 Tax=Carboxylicivirga sediminis TaxID=2006564 RepID=A0A941EYD3_9BACT|nr:amidohydrolase [Carboxylicivirga sediminis]MBR8534078.1 amidohydrolase [Carboxylicivirga sediminis]